MLEVSKTSQITQVTMRCLVHPVNSCCQIVHYESKFCHPIWHRNDLMSCLCAGQQWRDRTWQSYCHVHNEFKMKHFTSYNCKVFHWGKSQGTPTYSMPLSMPWSSFYTCSLVLPKTEDRVHYCYVDFRQHYPLSHRYSLFGLKSHQMRMINYCMNSFYKLQLNSPWTMWQDRLPVSDTTASWQDIWETDLTTSSTEPSSDVSSQEGGVSILEDP